VEHVQLAFNAKARIVSVKELPFEEQNIAERPIKQRRIEGFDALRVFALLLVLTSHLQSLWGSSAWTKIYGLDIGQIGVSSFLAISGALIGGDSRTPSEWLFARLMRIYPAYWIVTVVAFAATALTGYKQIEPMQFLWQMTGQGLYFMTDMVNVATWFIGLLIALYFSIYLFKRLGRMIEGITVCSLICLGIVMINEYESYFAHALAFYVSVGFSKSKRWEQLRWPLIGLLLALAIPNRILGYPAIGLLGVYAAQFVDKVPNLIKLFARYSYEFYLMHGIFLVGAKKLLGENTRTSLSVAMIVLSIATTWFAAAVLHEILRWCESKWFVRSRSKHVSFESEKP